MDIKFENNRLRKLANDVRKCKKELGERQATLFLRRLSDLRDAENLEDVRHLPGRFHELKETRKGQWACDLDHPYRLLFEPQQNPIPTNVDGQYIWFQIIAIQIIEIVDYH